MPVVTRYRMSSLILALIALYAVFFVLINAIVTWRPK
jgi:hypothetical protein